MYGPFAKTELLGVVHCRVQTCCRDACGWQFNDVMGEEMAENAEQLGVLCDELGFAGFGAEIRALLGGDWKVRRNLAGLRGRVDRHDVIIEELQRRVLEFEW